QQNFLTKEAKDLKNFRTQMSQESLHSAHKKEETAKLMKEFARLTQEGKFQEASKVAMQAREMDPDDPTTQAAMQMAQIMYRKDKWGKTKEEQERWNWEIGNDVYKFGPDVNTGDPVRFDKERFNE